MPFLKNIRIYICPILVLLLAACNTKPKPNTQNKPAKSIHIPATQVPKINLKYANSKQKNIAELQYKIDTFFCRHFDSLSINASVLVSYKGQIVYETYIGLAHYENPNDKLTPNTPMQLASVSKVFTATAILWCYQHKLLNIYDTLGVYLPRFPYPNIRIIDLLNHRSGLPNYLYFAEKLWPNKEKALTNIDILKLLYTHKPETQYPPNTHFSYCNTNYVLLATILERAVQQPFAHFMQHTIFTPLGMQNTFVHTLQDTAKQYPNPPAGSYNYYKRNETYNYLDGSYGDKNLYSTPQDMYRFNTALHSGLLADSILNLAFTPYSNENFGVKNYGLGWRLRILSNTQKIILHNGWWHGSNTVYYNIWEDDATIIILGNKYNRGIYQVIPLYDILKNKTTNLQAEDE